MHDPGSPSDKRRPPFFLYTTCSVALRERRRTIVSRPYVTTKAKMPDDVAKLIFFSLPFRLSLLDAAYLHLDCHSGGATSAFGEFS